MGPETDSLDYRAGVCYFICILSITRLSRPVGIYSFSVSPSALVHTCGAYGHLIKHMSWLTHLDSIKQPSRRKAQSGIGLD